MKQDNLSQADDAERAGRPGRWAIHGLIALCCLAELVLVAGDFGLIGTPRIRALAYEYGGFWPGLLRDWRPNYAAQPYAMFLTYAFLHGGPLHLAVNMVTLWSLGRAVVARVGQGGFLLLYFGAILGGGAGYGFLVSSALPMVGASGALFGLVGGILAWNYIDRFTFREQLWPVARAAGLLLLLNLVLWWAMDGQLAWETHLAGFITGWAMAILIDPRPREEDPA